MTTSTGERPLKILHIINALNLGGAESLLFRLATRSSANEHAVVSVGRAAWYSGRLEERGVQVHHLDMESPSTIPKGLLRLFKIIRESDADVVQCWMYRSNVLGGLTAKVVGKPVVWGVHCSSLSALRPISRALAHFTRLLSRSNPDFIVHCSAAAEKLHTKLGYARAKSRVIPNGYDADAFFPDEESRLDARRSLGLADRDFVIGSVTRWDRLKDVPNLLAAIGLARESGAQFRCLLAGADLDAGNRALAEAIARSGCGDVVDLLGRRTDVPNIARALDLHVLASRTEAMPNAVAETMLSGTPNVVTDVGDVPSLLSDTGWLVPPRNPHRLAQGILEALREWRDRPADWERRRERARQQIVENFSSDRMESAYEEVWRMVAGHRAR